MNHKINAEGALSEMASYSFEDLSQFVEQNACKEMGEAASAMKPVSFS